VKEVKGYSIYFSILQVYVDRLVVIGVKRARLEVPIIGLFNARFRRIVLHYPIVYCFKLAGILHQQGFDL
jgi:hypothetical protein